MKNKNLKELHSKHQEISEIKCPNCGEEIELIIQYDLFNNKKLGRCKKCNYEEPNYNK